MLPHAFTRQNPQFPTYWDDFLENLSGAAKSVLTTLPPEALDRLQDGYAHRMAQDLEDERPETLSTEDLMLRNMALFGEVRQGLTKNQPDKVPSYMSSLPSGEDLPELKQLLATAETWRQKSPDDRLRQIIREGDTGYPPLNRPNPYPLLSSSGVKNALAKPVASPQPVSKLKGEEPGIPQPNSGSLNSSQVIQKPKNIPQPKPKSKAAPNSSPLVPALPAMGAGTLNSSKSLPIPKAYDKLPEPRLIIVNPNMNFEGDWANSRALSWIDTKEGQEFFNAFAGYGTGLLEVPLVFLEFPSSILSNKSATKEIIKSINTMIDRIFNTNPELMIDRKSPEFDLGKLIGNEVASGALPVRGFQIAKKAKVSRQRYNELITSMKDFVETLEKNGVSKKKISMFTNELRNNYKIQTRVLDTPEAVRFAEIRNRLKYKNKVGLKWKEMVEKEIEAFKDSNKPLDMDAIYQKIIDSSLKTDPLINTWHLNFFDWVGSKVKK